MILSEGRNWHASYAARNYRHCMDCARAYSRRRYSKLKPNVKRRTPTTAGLPKTLVTRRQRALNERAASARKRREREAE
ncbi:MAG: hypothetical protein ACK4Z5_05885 [Brevundimonas sp.]